MKKILLSAYACEPNKGSEPGVGWLWAMELSQRNFDVHVITRLNNQPAINKFFETSKKPSNLTFHYFDVPKWLSWWKKGGRGVRTYYLFWQIIAYFFARKLTTQVNFSIVHHISFVTIRQPSFMGLLGIPFIFGPIGGGERSTLRCRKGIGFINFLIELARDFLNSLVKFDPLMWISFSSASEIYVTSHETKKLVPKIFHRKTFVQLAIYPDKGIKRDYNTSPQFDLLYVGRFLHWKGLFYLILAVKETQKIFPSISLTLIGRGRLEAKMQYLIHQLNLDKNVSILPWVERAKLSQLYDNHKIFVFPSLHDSGGMVVFEALSHSLPVICLNKGGPGTIINKGGGLLVEVNNNTQIVADLSTQISLLLGDTQLLHHYQKECFQVLRSFTFEERFKAFNLYHL